MIKLTILKNMLRLVYNSFICFLSKPKCIKFFLSISEIFSKDLANSFNNLIFLSIRLLVQTFWISRF